MNFEFDQKQVYYFPGDFPMNAKTIQAEIITIGDEILYGQITDTNSQWISEQLTQAGIKTIRKSSVGDDESEILKIAGEAEQRADIVLITGGLGPTNDDITKKTLCKYFNSYLELHPGALKDVTEFFQKRGRELTDINKQQAFLPKACKYIRNQWGTAPSMWFEKDNKVFVSMPGVPHEMKSLMKAEILPALKERFKPPFIYHKIIKTCGIGESYLAEKISDWESDLPEGMGLAYLPSLGEVKLRLTSTGSDEKKLIQRTGEEVKKLQSLIPDFIYGYDEETLPEVIGRLLKSKSLTLATAESCTGGYTGHLITSVAGSSAYYLGGVIAYDNSVKKNVLGVKEQTLQQFGAVSEETVKEMAEGVRRALKADIGISISGIAGPGGGTPEKPVGTIWIGYADGRKTTAKKLMFGNDRGVNIRLTGASVLNYLRQSLDQNS